MTKGATTIWERWDAIRPDGSIHPGEMLSFNHYAFGAIGAWLHRTVGGLAPAEPGYKRILIAPQPGGDITWARTRHDTPYGPAEAGWRIDGEKLIVNAEVPPNTMATIKVPGSAQPFEVGSGDYEWTVDRST